MIVVCRDCDTSFNLEERLIKPSGSKVRCSKCKSVFRVFPQIDALADETAQGKDVFDETVELSVKDKDVAAAGKFDFSGFDDLDKENKSPEDESLPEKNKEEEKSALGKFDFAFLDEKKESETKEVPGAGKEESALSDDKFDLSEFDKIFDEEVPAAADAPEDKDKEPVSDDTEDIDFSDLEKMLEAGAGEKIPGKKRDEPVPESEGDLDLSELESIIDNLEEEVAVEKAGEPEELKFDIEPARDEIISKIDDEEELDYSDLEKMLDTGETEKKGVEKKPELKLDMETESAAKTEGIDDSGDLDLSELDKLIGSLDKPESEALSEKEPQTLDLDFSDFDSVLEAETTEAEKGGEKEQDLELKFDSEPEKAVSPEGKPDDLDLDFSEVEKMLEMEEKSDLPAQKVQEESLDLELVTEEPSEKPQEASAWADTIVTDKEGLGLAEKDSEEEPYPHLEEYSIEKFRSTVEMQEAAAAGDTAPQPEEGITEPEMEIKPVKSGKPSGRFLTVVGIVLIIIASAGAFAVYNPFGLEIPFVSDLIDTKGDEKGTLKIRPVDESIKGEYVQSKTGNLFVITGTAKNEYKHPRSYISVTGKLFKKGKVLLKAETVFCGNLIPPNDLGAADPALMKKRLQNRLGDGKSNVKIQPGGTVPFMIIFENITDELDEYSVESAGSVKE